MSIQVKFRRGTSTQHNSFTGADGEITVDSTNKTVRVHDGSTVGGHRLAKYNEIVVANLSPLATWTSLLGTNTAIRILVSDRLQIANAAATYTTKAYAAANSYVNYVLANTNSYIATKASWSALTGTNTAIRTLVSDRMQVANTKAYLANTNSYIATRASWTALTGTNTAIRTLVSDRYQVANVNTLLATKATWTALTGTNTALRTLISDRLQVANAAATYQTKATERAALANTNAYIKAQLANTNSYIAAQASRITLVNSNLTGTNTALRLLVSNEISAVIGAAPAALDTLQELANALGNNANFASATTNLISTKISVANTKAYLANTNAFIKTQLANTNAYIATKASCLL